MSQLRYYSLPTQKPFYVPRDLITCSHVFIRLDRVYSPLQPTYTGPLRWLGREFTDRTVRGSNPTSASRLPLSRLGQPGSSSALVLPSGGMAVRHRKGVTAERFHFIFQTTDNQETCSSESVKRNTTICVQTNSEELLQLTLKTISPPFEPFHFAVKLTTQTPLSPISSHTVQRLRPGAVGNMRIHPGRRVAPTAPKSLVISFLPLCFRHCELGTKNSTLFTKRWFSMRNTSLNQRSFSYTDQTGEVSQPDTHVPQDSEIYRFDAIGKRGPSQIRAFTSSATLHSELIQLPRYVKRSTTLKNSPRIVSGAFSDRMSRSMTLQYT
ncbi:hypothetical protein CSKR_107757 [Clonorchis sinensis]|uniref:Uncharacterized protein n=1 Tax=Clonorchis sinensis TaxID=79923 RepID=A0A419Q7C0_CLOSI|nr:hypothetical protein CSKR_107757 [Clonorchis sinensis]